MKRQIKLTYPSTLTDEDSEYLYNLYRERFSDEFERWVQIEKEYVDPKQNPLTEINKNVLKFLMENAAWESSMALSAAWLAVRRKVIRFAKAH